MAITHELSAEFPDDRSKAQERELRAARMILRMETAPFQLDQSSPISFN